MSLPEIGSWYCEFWQLNEVSKDACPSFTNVMRKGFILVITLTTMYIIYHIVT